MNWEFGQYGGGRGCNMAEQGPQCSELIISVNFATKKMTINEKKEEKEEKDEKDKIDKKEEKE